MTDTLFESRAAASAAVQPDFSRRKSRELLPPDELQAQRREAVRAGCVYLKGKDGVTVFRPFGLPLSSWDGHKRASTAKRKLIPGIGFADL
jgi:hypothetical protein